MGRDRSGEREAIRKVLIHPLGEGADDLRASMRRRRKAQKPRKGAERSLPGVTNLARWGVSLGVVWTIGGIFIVASLGGSPHFSPYLVLGIAGPVLGLHYIISSIGLFGRRWWSRIAAEIALALTILTLGAFAALSVPNTAGMLDIPVPLLGAILGLWTTVILVLLQWIGPISLGVFSITGISAWAFIIARLIPRMSVLTSIFPAIWKVALPPVAMGICARAIKYLEGKEVKLAFFHQMKKAFLKKRASRRRKRR
ncbi:MAG: hypothetical protein ACUVXI_01185 [bacterium]